MKKEIFKDAIYELFEYFQRKEMPKDKILDRWYEKTKKIPDKALLKIIDTIEGGDSLPRNIPKAFYAAYGNLPTGSKRIEYDKYDDPKYPIQNLWTALKILGVSGEDEFKRYCASTAMPEQDIERVINKHNFVYDINELSENILKSA